MMNYNTNIQQQQIGRSSKYEVNIPQIALAYASWQTNSRSIAKLKFSDKEIDDPREKIKESALKNHKLLALFSEYSLRLELSEHLLC